MNTRLAQEREATVIWRPEIAITIDERAAVWAEATKLKMPLQDYLAMIIRERRKG